MILIKQGKTNIKYLLIVAVLAAIIGGVILWFSQQQILSYQPLEIKIPEKVESETADWQIYSNEEYGFEVKYPKELSIEQGGPLVKPNIFYFGGGPYETAISLVVSNIEETEPFSSLEQTEVTEITIDNKKGIRYEREWEVPAEFARGVPVAAHTNRMISVDVQHSGKNYRFHLINSTDFQDVFNTFDQMLSAFRFLD